MRKTGSCKRKGGTKRKRSVSGRWRVGWKGGREKWGAAKKDLQE